MAAELDGIAIVISPGAWPDAPEPPGQLVSADGELLPAVVGVAVTTSEGVIADADGLGQRGVGLAGCVTSG